MALYNPHISAYQFGPLVGVSVGELDRSTAVVTSYVDGTFKPTPGWVDSAKALLGFSTALEHTEEAKDTAEGTESPATDYPKIAERLASSMEAVKSSSATDLPDATIIGELWTLRNDGSAHSQVKSAAETLSFYGQKVLDHRRR